MARPKTRCECGKRTKSPHGLLIHRMRVHLHYNWNDRGLYRKKKKVA